MICSHARKYFDTLYVNEAAVPRAIKEHIGACPRCSPTFRQWAAFVKSLESGPVPETPPFLALRIKARMQESGRRQSTAWGLKFAFTALALIAVCGALGWFVVREKSPLAPALTQKENAGVFKIIVSEAFPQARQIAIVGDFNAWNPRRDYLVKNRDGSWSITLKLDKGNYQYQLVIDNTTWSADPGNPVSIADGFGGYNSGMEL
ncbi:MAG: hypothetical protein PHC61_06000 [Chitinivibrionales bacterium]|nr:hypothetical protein [Chitinivibrionales bacterium]